MKIFQFYFNPKKKGLLLESFCYSPNGRNEEEFGNLYIVGEVKNVPRYRKDLLKELASVIKKEYYDPEERNLGKAFQNSLDKANVFLEENSESFSEVSMAVFSLTPGFSSLFSKTGNLKTFVFREGQMFDVENDSLKKEGFSSVAQGGLEKGDIMLFLTEELFNRFWEENLFKEMGLIKKPRELKKLFKEKSDMFRELFGLLVVVFVRKELINWNRIFKMPNIEIRMPRTVFFEEKISKKILPQSPDLRQSIKKGFKYFLILIIILLLGYLIF
jgi:hypothetical protein